MKCRDKNAEKRETEKLKISENTWRKLEKIAIWIGCKKLNDNIAYENFG